MNPFQHFFTKLKADIYKKSKIDCSNSKGCVIWSGSKTTNGHYGKKRVTWPDGYRETAKVHKLVMMTILKKRVKRHIPILATVNDKKVKLEVSHICHSSLCVNPKHLLLETHERNMERRTCRVQKLCTQTHHPICIM